MIHRQRLIRTFAFFVLLTFERVAVEAAASRKGEPILPRIQTVRHRGLKSLTDQSKILQNHRRVPKGTKYS
jgi:hypothetical protein